MKLKNRYQDFILFYGIVSYFLMTANRMRVSSRLLHSQKTQYSVIDLSSHQSKNIFQDIPKGNISIFENRGISTFVDLCCPKFWDLLILVQLITLHNSPPLILVHPLTSHKNYSYATSMGTPIQKNSFFSCFVFVKKLYQRV